MDKKPNLLLWRENFERIHPDMVGDDFETKTETVAIVAAILTVSEILDQRLAMIERELLRRRFT